MSSQKKTSPLAIAAAWILVSIPAVWGIYNTALNAAKLFAAPAGTAISAGASK